MPINLNDVQAAAAPTMAPPTAPVMPTAPAAAAPAPVAPPQNEKGHSIPDEILRIPAFNGLLQGKPAAIYSPTGVKNPELAAITNHVKELTDAGFGFYVGKSLPVNVLYNILFISPQQIAAADAAGKLESVAEPYDQVKSSFDAVKKGAAPETPAPAAPASPAPVANAGAPPPASVDNKLATARINNLQPGSPNGAGRILSAIQRPVV